MKLESDLIEGKFYGRVLDDESIKALMGDEKLYLYDQKENSPTYIKWLKANKETGITQAEWARENNILDFRKVVKKESFDLWKKSEEKLSNALNDFIAKNKDKIYKAQIEAYEKEVSENKKRYKDSLEKATAIYAGGNEIAVSTLQKDDNIDFLNLLLSLGYKVKNTTASMVFLYFNRVDELTTEELEKISEYTGNTGYCSVCIEPKIDGVSFSKEYFLVGYDYGKWKEYSKSQVFLQAF